LGIYGAILISIFLVLVISYFALEALNHYRYQKHLQQIVSGTVYLLSQGVARQQGDNQERWLSLVSSLLETNVRLEPLDFEPDGGSLQMLPLLLDTGERADGYLVSYPMPQVKARLVWEVDAVTEKLITTTAFLLLNEVGRHQVDKRQHVFNQIRQQLAYQASRQKSSNLSLDSRQLGRLKRGETIVEWDKQFGRGLSLNIYAPWGNTQDVLALGPIEFFDPYPAHIVASFFLLALLLIAITLMLIIRHLAQRIYQIQDEVDAIGSAYIEPITGDRERDAIATLNDKIQSMATRLKKLLDEKSYMIRAISHDLRTPIARLHFRLESLAINLGDDHPMLNSCKADLGQLNVLIDELLAYEKFSVAKGVEFEAIDILELATEQCQSIEGCYPNLSFNIQHDLASGFEINGNPLLLKRLLENLLNNAARYAKSKIVVSLQSREQHLYLKIDDDGPGIDEDDLPQLFNPFFRADKSRNSESGGYGLGLAIVKQVAMQHNASIEAANNSAGGAQFVLVLPPLQQQKANNNQTSDWV